jgi:hypothetical protein
MIEGDVIECCVHMGSFHVPTGMVMQPPCEVPLRTYQVVLKDEDVFADLTHNAAGEAEKRSLSSRGDASSSLLARGKWAMCIYRRKLKLISRKRVVRSCYSQPRRRFMRSTSRLQRRSGFFT